MGIYRLVLAGLLALSLAGCATGPSKADPVRRLAKAEDLFDTGGTITSQYHAALYYPFEVSLRFDGYLVGVEKSPREKIDPTRGAKIRDIPEAGLGDGKARKLLDDGKLMWVSHVLKNRADKPWMKNCSIYNAYALRGEELPPQLVRACDSPAEFWEPKAAFENSWTAMRRLQQAVTADITKGDYTHIFVLVMGWNTVQEEAVRNFNSLATQLVRASNEKVKPLVIGVTWPSQWNSDWADPLYKLTSFPVKAQDADELGLTWLGVLLHDVLPQAKGDVPVVVVGHSFGSRASSVAACIGPAIHSGPTELNRKTIDMVFNFQGAFPTKRLLVDREDKDQEGMRYPAGCANVQRFVMTSSSNDLAVTLARWELYAGGGNSYEEFCGRQYAGLTCAKAKSDGGVENWPGAPSQSIMYVDASDLIAENAYRTGGGAHSDIYRIEHGQLLTRFLPFGRRSEQRAQQGAGEKR